MSLHRHFRKTWLSQVIEDQNGNGCKSAFGSSLWSVLSVVGSLCGRFSLRSVLSVRPFQEIARTHCNSSSISLIENTFVFASSLACLIVSLIGMSQPRASAY